jgi:thiamine biosynthesis lipoprotein
MDRRIYRISAEVAAGIILIAAIVLLTRTEDTSGWPPDREDFDSGRRITMGTFAWVVAVAEDSQTAASCAEKGIAEILRIEELMSDYKDDSDISLLNRDGFKGPVKLSADSFELLERSCEISRMTGGAFDVTAGPLVDLWRVAGATNSLPSDAEIAKTLEKVGFGKLRLDRDKMTARFDVDGMRVDPGAVAKGYAVDAAVSAAKRNGAMGAMVEIGGDIRCFGAPPRNKNAWRIGLENAGSGRRGGGSDSILIVLKIPDAAVATSGHHRRFAVVEGRRISHIVDTSDGSGSDKLSSVTVIAPTATDADALATAVIVMGREKGLELIESLPETEAILVGNAPEYEIVKSGGADGYID